MKTETFYQRVTEIAGRPPDERHRLLAVLHNEILTWYLGVIRRMTEQEAQGTSSDGRTLGQIVGHIAEWERYTILAVGEILAGVEWPRIMSLSGYVEPDGRVLDFASVDDFNAHQTSKQKEWPWARIQVLAVRTATALHTLFTQPGLVSAECLGQTKEYKWQLADGAGLAVPAGWYLWMVTLEHEGVEHASDLAGGDGV